MVWESSDEQYKYIVVPRGSIAGDSWQLASDSDQLEDMNIWSLTRLRRGGGDTVSLDRYTIIAGRSLIVSRHEVPRDILAADGKDEFIAMMDAELQFQYELGMTEPQASDYDNVDAALRDLAVLVRQTQIASRESAQAVELDVPEANGPAQPQWWIVCSRAAQYAVFTANRDEAPQLIENAGGYSLSPPLSVGFYDEASQREFSTRYPAGQEVGRLIPYSTEPWPEDEYAITLAQQMALGRWYRLN
jgi:hypothetical protein